MKTTRIASMIMVIISLIVYTVASIEAAELSSMKSRAWARHAEGMADLCLCFKNGSENKKYDVAIFKIVSAEINLLAYGVSPKHPDLVSRLASETGKQVDQTTFAYRVLKEQIRKKSGFVPDPAGAFKSQKFKGITSTTGQLSGVIEVTTLD